MLHLSHILWYDIWVRIIPALPGYAWACRRLCCRERWNVVATHCLHIHSFMIS